MKPIYLFYDERMKLHFDQRSKRNGNEEESHYQHIVDHLDNKTNDDDDTAPIGGGGGDGDGEGNTTNTNSSSNYPPELLTEVEDDNNDENDDDDDDESLTVENPKRITFIYNRLNQLEQTYLKTTHSDSHHEKMFIRLPCTLATKETITLAHSLRYYDKVKQTQLMSLKELQSFPTIDFTNSNNDEENEVKDDEDMYFCKDTFTAALAACGGVVEAVNRVTAFPSTTTDSARALALVRPPGHHACAEKAMGFCFFNSVVVAAKHAIHTKRAKRVLILDWDIHHGNGSQELTYDDGNIFYISLHRYTKGTSRMEPFFPGTGLPSEVGLKDTSAHGMNLNIAWRSGGMGNNEYAAAFSELILPILSQFSPDLVLISCGLDAAAGDLLGDCLLTPRMYYVMMRSLMTTVGLDTPIVVALEGGYNLEVISYCMEAVALALLDLEYQGKREVEHKPMPQDRPITQSATNTNDSNDQISSDSERFVRLDKGRELLNQFWDYRDKNNQLINASAVRDINSSIDAIKDTRWNNDKILSLNPRRSKRITTRSHSRIQTDIETQDVSDLLESLKI